MVRPDRPPNVALLRQTLVHIEAHPDQWDQTKWVNSCGTAFCFAGHAAILNGAQVCRYAGEVVSDVVVPEGADEPKLVEWHAAEILGLDEREYVSSKGWVEYGVELFDAGNSLDDLRRIVGELCGGAE